MSLICSSTNFRKKTISNTDNTLITLGTTTSFQDHMPHPRTTASLRALKLSSKPIGARDSLTKRSHSFTEIERWVRDHFPNAEKSGDLFSHKYKIKGTVVAVINLYDGTSFIGHFGDPRGYWEDKEEE